MKFVLIPPYSDTELKSSWEQELVARWEKNGQLQDIEIDIAEGYVTEHSENRDEVFAASVEVGAIKKIKEYSEMGKYDAIIIGGTSEPGFNAAQTISKIPVAYSIHSAVHIASLIGERFSFIHLSDAACHTIRHRVNNHGLGHKLISVRPLGYSAPYMKRFTQKYKEEERAKVPKGKEIIGEIVNLCKVAIEKDMVDTIIFECPVMQIFENEIKQELDDSGYGEIQVVYSNLAAVEMAKVLVSMKLIMAPRAYPSASLKAKPEYR